MLDGQWRRAYIMFLPEGIVFAAPHVAATLVASFWHQSFQVNEDVKDCYNTILRLDIKSS
jgi:hypothetical protein